MSDLSEEQKENRKEWVEALRSGNYEQGQEGLFYKEGNKEKYCCLGVACSILGYQNVQLNDCSYINEPYYGASIENDKPSEKFGLNIKQQELLAYLNDQGISFNDIAAVIESNFSIDIIREKTKDMDDNSLNTIEHMINAIK